MRRVVVTGVGAVSPCGLTVSESWKKVCSGLSGVGRITLFDASDWPVQIAAEVKGYDPLRDMSEKTAKRLDRYAQFAMTASAEALKNAGLVGPLGERAGCSIGTGIGGVGEISDGALRNDKGGPKRLGALFITKSLPNIAGGMVAIEHGLKGPGLCISTACAAGAHSIGESYRNILHGDADIMVTGGAEAPIIPTGIGGFMIMRALSRNNTYPDRASRPFDKNRDGFIVGEGAGVLVLESLTHALNRQAPILAEVIGYAHNNDAFHISAPAPRHEGAARCMKLALQNASITPKDVDYINAHGTSTMQNDANECRAIRDVFGNAADELVVSSTKGATGHLLGAAGGLEAIFTVLSLHHQLAPPTANLHERDPDCNLDIVALKSREMPINVALSNSFGFGGYNASLIFKRWSNE